MRTGKQNISNSNIEKEIYNTFALFKKEKNISIADFLNRFDVTAFKQQEYRKIKFPYESLIKLVLFQKLKGIKFHTKLTKYLRRNPSIKWKLGFSQTPDRTTIGYFVNRTLDDKTKELLDFTVNKILEVSEKFGLLFDINTLETEKPIKETKERNQYLQKDKQTKEACKLFKKRFAPFINLHLGKNAVYKKNTLIDLLIHMGLTQDFAENGSRVFKEQRSIGPNADTLLYHLKKYSNIRELQRMYETLFEVIWGMARKTNLFDVRKRVDVAVDYTEWPYYGNRRAPFVVGKMPERGATSCYKFATINIVESGKRFTLLAVPVNALSGKEQILSKLLLYAMKRVKINRVYLDRGFFDSKSISVLNHLGLKWLMPGQKNYLIRRTMKLASVPSVIKDFTMKNVKFNLIVANDKDGVKRVFATNERYEENAVGLVERLFYLYSKRWGIETSYRVKKHSYRPKTTSKNYLIRLFYFLFSVLLYNLWILADVLVWLHLFGKIGDKHLLTSKYFGSVLMAIDPGG